MIQLNKLQFISSIPYDHVFKKGSISYTTNGLGQSSFSVAHNLGYIPFVRNFIQFPTDPNIYQLVSGVVGPLSGEVVDYEITTTAINITVNFAANTSTGIYYYRIYENPQP